MSQDVFRHDDRGGVPQMHATTILMVRKGGRVVLGGDGQVSLGQTIVKGNARKVRRLAKGAVIGGFAGATADAFTLFERLEAKLEQYPGQLTRACVELTKDWRTDRYLRRLEAMMLVADREVSLLLSGSGDVLEPESGVMAIGSGGNYALAAARALEDGDLDAEAIVRRAMAIAAEICVYTNGNLVIEALDAGEPVSRRCRRPRRARPRMETAAAAAEAAPPTLRSQTILRPARGAAGEASSTPAETLQFVFALRRKLTVGSHATGAAEFVEQPLAPYSDGHRRCGINVSRH